MRDPLGIVVTFFGTRGPLPGGLSGAAHAVVGLQRPKRRVHCRGVAAGYDPERARGGGGWREVEHPARRTHPEVIQAIFCFKAVYICCMEDGACPSHHFIRSIPHSDTPGRSACQLCSSAAAVSGSALRHSRWMVDALCFYLPPICLAAAVGLCPTPSAVLLATPPHPTPPLPVAAGIHRAPAVQCSNPEPAALPRKCSPLERATCRSLAPTRSK